MPERRPSHPKAPTGLNDETAEEVHDIIHRAEVEEQKVSDQVPLDGTCD